MDMIYYIAIGSGIFAAVLFTFIISKDVIFLRLKALGKRKKNYLLVHALDKDKRITSQILQHKDYLIQGKNKRYKYDSEHVYNDPVYNMPAVVVSEQLSKSINPHAEEERTPLSPKTIDDAVLAAAMAEGEFFRKAIQYMGIAIAVNTIGIIACVVMCYMLINSAKEAGMTLTF